MKTIAVLLFMLLASTLFAKEPVAVPWQIEGENYVCLEAGFAGNALQIIRDKYPVTKKALEQAEKTIAEFVNLEIKLREVITQKDTIIEGQSDRISYLVNDNAEMKAGQEAQFGYYTLFTASGFVVGAGVTVLIIYAAKGAL